MDGIPPPTRQDMVAMLVTEHFTLQGARSATISDANGRTSFFLGTLSGVVVALAFVAQISGMGDAFFVFAMVLLPMLLFIGLASFERLLQLGIENIRCVVAINRIRHYYLEVAPELRAHFTLSPNDDTQGVLTSLGSLRGNVRPWDIFVTNAGMVAVVNGIIGGVVAALIAWQLRLGMAGDGRDRDPGWLGRARSPGRLPREFVADERTDHRQPFPDPWRRARPLPLRPVGRGVGPRTRTRPRPAARRRCGARS